MTEDNKKLALLDNFEKAIALIAGADLVEAVDWMSKAEALRVYSTKAKKGLEIQNQCAEIKLRAERRAGELLKEMEKNEGGRPSETSNIVLSVSPKLSDLGISKMQSHRWQLEAKVPEEKFKEWVIEVETKNEEVTSASLQQLAKGKPHISHATGENEWYTPQVYIDAAREVMGPIDTDPASADIANRIVKATTYYTLQNDGRRKQWTGNVWLNPPYSQPLVSEFCELLVDKYRKKEIKQACVLVNNATETNFYQDMLNCCSAVCFIKGRVRFVNEAGIESGAPLQGQTVLYFGLNTGRFAHCFGRFGVILYDKGHDPE